MYSYGLYDNFSLILSAATLAVLNGLGNNKEQIHKT